jgi:hypothetical protein
MPRYNQKAVKKFSMMAQVVTAGEIWLVIRDTRRVRAGTYAIVTVGGLGCVVTRWKV